MCSNAHAGERTNARAPARRVQIQMATQKRSRQNKDIASEGKGMHPSDAISVAFCDLSEVSCRGASRHSLFNSARGPPRPRGFWSPSPRVPERERERERETHINKGATASLGGGRRGRRYGASPGRLLTRHANVLKADAALPEEHQAKTDLYHA